MEVKFCKQDSKNVDIVDLECCKALANYILSVLPDTHELYQFVMIVLDTLSAMLSSSDVSMNTYDVHLWYIVDAFVQK